MSDPEANKYHCTPISATQISYIATKYINETLTRKRRDFGQDIYDMNNDVAASDARVHRGPNNGVHKI